MVVSPWRGMGGEVIMVRLRLCGGSSICTSNSSSSSSRCIVVLGGIRND